MSRPLRFMQQQIESLESGGAIIRCQGLEQKWTAPVAYFDAPSGFGEAAWVDAQSDTVLAWHISGATVISECRPTRGMAVVDGQPMFALQPAGTPNHYRADGPVRFAQLFLPDTLVAAARDQLGDSESSRRSLRDDLFTEDQQMYDWLMAYMRRANDRIELASTLEMQARALLIVERLLTRHHDLSNRSGVLPVRYDWRIRRSLEEIEARLHEDLGLVELAAAVGLSPSHYATLFRASVGMPPHAWLVKRRIARACEMLANPCVAITDIAFALGFPSSQHFATTFRKQMGATPSEWRRQRLF